MVGRAVSRRDYEEPLLRVEDLVKHYPSSGGGRRNSQAVRAVDGVSLQVETAETFALVGESGCGKSTLGRLVVRLEEPTSGTVQFMGSDLTNLGRRQLRPHRRDMQVVFQNPHSSLNPRMTVRQIVEEPLVVHDIDDRIGRVDRLLELVGLPPAVADRHAHEFSGGQRQRIGLARALSTEPTFLLLDEPVSALDVSIQAQILNLLVELRDELSLTYFFISHDLGVVRYLADRVAVMYLGRIVELASVFDLFASPAHPYTEALMSAVPSRDPEAGSQRIILKGELPSAASPPSGCRFRTRCPMARPECATDEPELRLVGGDHLVACHFAEEMMEKHR